MRQKCYFSYDWKNKPAITTTLRLFKKAIERTSKGTIQVIWDEEFHYGDNFKKNEEIIRDCDSVVIFFTTEYKDSVEKGSLDRGVFREYRIIQEARRVSNIKVMSVLLLGSISSSVTKEFKDDIAADFSSKPFSSLSRNQRAIVNPEHKKRFNDTIADIVYETDQSARRKEYHFSSKEEAYRALFVETEDNHKLPKDAMYCLEIYKDIFSESGSGFIIGRKGSGKSTLFTILENYDRLKYDSKFKVLRPISAEHIRIEYIYNAYSDFSMDEKLFGREQILSLFWAIYLYLCTIYIVCVEEEKNHIRDDRKNDFHKASTKLKKELNVDKLDTSQVARAIFIKSVDLWSSFMSTSILDHSTDTSFVPSMVANFKVDRILEGFFGKGLFNKLKIDISRCEKKVLLALDNFNANSDDFRRGAKEEIKSGIEEAVSKGFDKVDFEGVFYRSLITTVDGFRAEAADLMQKVVFCIIIPQDRVDQIALVDRDFSKRHFSHLSWDAIELLTLVLLRLKTVFGFDLNLDSDVDIVNTYNLVMKKYLSSIPTTITVNTNMGDRRFDLFQYMLRCSFWRPRDIIKYFSVLVDANEKCQARGGTIDNGTLKSLMDAVTEDIIRSEFYMEYDRVIYNIEDFVAQFRYGSILLTVDDAVQKIKGFRFEGAIFRNRTELIDKIETLYEMGVFGIILNKEVVSEDTTTIPVFFAFSEGMKQFSAIKDSLLKEQNKYCFLINPIFQEKYHLNSVNQELAIDYTWDYLKSNHLRKSTIDRP